MILIYLWKTHRQHIPDKMKDIIIEDSEYGKAFRHLGQTVTKIQKNYVFHTSNMQIVNGVIT